MAEPSTAADPIGVTVLGGYLGAGKTTLLNHLLANATERIAVLVNDFGSINIDERLIESADDDKISLANGCICCSLIDGFAAALETVTSLDDPPPRLVIEASGVADPAQVAAYGHGPGLRLDGVVVLVDTETIVRRLADEYVGDTVAGQLRSADLIVLNKIDLVDDTTRDRVRAAVEVRTGAVEMIEAVQARVDPDVVMGPVTPSIVPPMTPRTAPRTATPGGGPAETDAGAVHRTRTFVAEGPVDRSGLTAWLDGLPAGVVRVKGLVRFTDEPDTTEVVQRVGRRSTIGRWVRPADEVVLVAIATAAAGDFEVPPGFGEPTGGAHDHGHGEHG